MKTNLNRSFFKRPLGFEDALKFLWLLTTTFLIGAFIGGFAAKGASYQHDLDKAERYYEAGDYQKAAKHWEKAIAGDDKTLMDDIKLAAKDLPLQIDDQFMDDVLYHSLKRAATWQFENLSACLFAVTPFDSKLFNLYQLLSFYAKASA